MNAPAPRSLAAALGAILAARSAPWRAKTFLLAAVVSLLGLGLWVRDGLRGQPAAPTEIGVASPASPASGWDFRRPVPGATRVCGSYAGAFLVGWALRRFLRTALALAAVLLGLLALGRWAGWDTTQAETQVKPGTSLVERQAGAAKNFLLELLPSATAAGVGGCLGFRRKNTGEPA